MVATPAIDGAAAWIASEAQLQRRFLDLQVQLKRGIERQLAAAVGDQFDRLQQTASANVADMAVIAEAVVEAPLQMPTECPSQDAFATDKSKASAQ